MTDRCLPRRAFRVELHDLVAEFGELRLKRRDPRGLLLKPRAHHLRLELAQSSTMRLPSASGDIALRPCVGDPATGAGGCSAFHRASTARVTRAGNESPGKTSQSTRSSDFGPLYTLRQSYGRSHPGGPRMIRMALAPSRLTLILITLLALGPSLMDARGQPNSVWLRNSLYRRQSDNAPLLRVRRG